MNEIKSYILEFIWSGKNISDFEQWLYQQNSTEFENLIGVSNYLELISYDYKKKTTDQIKYFFKTILNNSIMEEFETEFKKRKSKAIIGKCIKNVALNYHEKTERNWNVEIGKEYEFLIVNSGIEKGNHSALVNYVDKTNSFKPSGFIPMELFEIDLTNISDFYHQVSNAGKGTTIEIKAFSEKQYIPNEYSFWEDYYNDEKKAVDTYLETLEKMEIKNVW